MTSTVAFPGHTTDQLESMSSVSVLSRQATALEICDMVYGNKTPSWEAIEHYYEPSAIYENPFVTATSREILADISSLTRQLSRLDIPRPIAMLHTLLRLNSNHKFDQPWFRALEVWSEIDEILESDTFDGHHRTIVGHTLHVLFLPSLHKEQASYTVDQHSRQLSMASHFDSSVLASSSYPQPKLSIAGINVPSPMHFQLRVLTRLSMNEQGRITHHRDFWDVKDLLGLVPGASLAQWITTRITGYSLSMVGRFGMWVFGGWGGRGADQNDEDEIEIGPPTTGRATRSSSVTSATAYARHIRHHHSYSGHRT